jgi:LacI family transcriptional regulator
VGRHLGYAAAVNAHRSIVRRSHVVRTIEGPEGADNALRRLLAKDDPPTAIVAATDETATAMMAALLRRGLSVPRDMSLLGIGGPTWITHIVAADPGPARVAIGLALDQAGYGGTNAPVQMELGVRLVDAATTSPP